MNIRNFIRHTLMESSVPEVTQSFLKQRIPFLKQFHGFQPAKPSENIKVQYRKQWDNELSITYGVHKRIEIPRVVLNATFTCSSKLHRDVLKEKELNSAEPIWATTYTIELATSHAWTFPQAPSFMDEQSIIRMYIQIGEIQSELARKYKFLREFKVYMRPDLKGDSEIEEALNDINKLLFEMEEEFSKFGVEVF